MTDMKTNFVNFWNFTKKHNDVYKNKNRDNLKKYVDGKLSSILYDDKNLFYKAIEDSTSKCEVSIFSGVYTPFDGYVKIYNFITNFFNNEDNLVSRQSNIKFHNMLFYPYEKEIKITISPIDMHQLIYYVAIRVYVASSIWKNCTSCPKMAYAPLINEKEEYI